MFGRWRWVCVNLTGWPHTADCSDGYAALRVDWSGVYRQAAECRRTAAAVVTRGVVFVGRLAPGDSVQKKSDAAAALCV